MPPPRKLAAAGTLLMLVLAFTVFRPPSTPGPLERDFEAYYAAGATLNAGGDPYSRDIWAAEQRIGGVAANRDELLPFIGPAATLPFWSLLARLPYRVALGMWTFILVAALGVVVVAALRIARRRQSAWLYCNAAVFAIASAPLLGALALGQAALVSAAAVAAAVVAYRARWAGGAFSATLVAAVQPNLTFALIARIRSRWDFSVAALATIVFAMLTFVGYGGAGFFTYLQRLAAHGQAERFIAIQHTPVAILYALGLPNSVAVAISIFIAFGAAGALAVLILRERLDPTTATLLACALLPLAIPFFHEHDFVLELLPILVLAMRARGPARSLAAVAAVLVLVDWFGLAQRHLAQGQIVSLGLALALGFIALDRSDKRGRRLDYAGPLVLVALAAIAMPLASLHRAPTWPDFLPANYHASSTADASAVWADEQRRAGLLRRDPVWSLLRSLPLGGCVLLSVALVTDARQRRRDDLRTRRQYIDTRVLRSTIVSTV